MVNFARARTWRAVANRALQLQAEVMEYDASLYYAIGDRCFLKLCRERRSRSEKREADRGLNQPCALYCRKACTKKR